MGVKHEGRVDFPSTIVSPDARIRLEPDENGIVPIKNRRGEVIGRIVAVEPGGWGMLQISFDLDAPLESDDSMTFTYGVTMSFE